MKFTEKLLLDTYSGITKCGDFISCVKDNKGNTFKVFWLYSCGSDLNFRITENRDDAEKIIIKDEPFGKRYSCDVPKRCMNKEMYAKVMNDYKSWCKDVENGKV